MNIITNSIICHSPLENGRVDPFWHYCFSKTLGQTSKDVRREIETQVEVPVRNVVNYLVRWNIVWAVYPEYPEFIL